MTTEREVVTVMIRRQKLPMSRAGHLSVDVVWSLVRKIRRK